MKFAFSLFVFCWFRGLSALPTDSVPDSVFFYHPTEYGSNAFFNPATVLLNGGFDIFQTGYQKTNPWAIAYGTGFRNVFRNIASPLDNIQQYGWSRFIKNEILPASLNADHAQYLPNYTLHLIGGGMTYRTLWEWNTFHQIPFPRLTAAAFSLGYHVLNEAVENGDYTGVNVDPIADLLFFDPLGIVLFQSNRVARFFGETLNGRDWSTFPLYDPFYERLDNVSQNYAFFIPLPKTRRYSLFVYLGMNEVAGLSLRLEKGYHLSGGGGLTIKEIVPADADKINGRTMTVQYRWNGALFLDYNRSLLASFMVSAQRLYRMRLSLFPLPYFACSTIKPAFFAALDQQNRPVVGLSAAWFPVFLSVGGRRPR